MEPKKIWIYIVMAALFACTPSQPDKPNVIPSEGDDMMCERTPTAYLVGESNSKDECGHSAKIQAIAYECGEAKDTASFTRQAFQDEVTQASKKCDEYCKEQGKGCVGDFRAPFDCGLKSRPPIALSFGTNEIHCPKRCKGQAFNYCSIYHANFLSVSDRSLFKDMKDNCICRKK